MLTVVLCAPAAEPAGGASTAATRGLEARSDVAFLDGPSGAAILPATASEGPLPNLGDAPPQLDEELQPVKRLQQRHHAFHAAQRHVACRS